MLKKYRRPLHKKERQSLSRALDTVPRIVTISGALRWFLLWAGVLVVCIWLVVTGLFQKGGVWTVVMPVVFIVGVLAFYFAYMIVSGYFHWSRYSDQFARDDAPKIRAALEDGRASVCSVTSDGVIVVEEWEDEGSAYIYDLGDGTSLYLRGQEYLPQDDNAPWPARRFEIVRTALDESFVGIFGAKEALEPMRVIPMADMPEGFLSDERPQTEKVLQGRPSEILERLRDAS